LVDLSVIVVSFNTRDLTLKCLESAYSDLQSCGFVFQIIVVDNASTDGSANAIGLRFPAIQVINNSTNAGFGAANNIGMKVATGRFFILLNSDAFLHAGACRSMVDHLFNEPEVGVVGPQLLNADGSLQRSCFPFPSPVRAWVENLFLAKLFSHRHRLGDFRKWNHDSTESVPWVVGACMAVRRDAYVKAGGFDERFFMYAEETDWQKRIRGHGFDVQFTPHAKVTHLGGSSGASDRSQTNHQFFASLDAYEEKHHGFLGLLSLRAAMVVGSTVRLLGWSAVAIVSSTKKETHKRKARFSAWLLKRQLTHWHRVG